ncbi:dicarboxylate/amino acid:cation symporter [Olsenella porci]|jgi:Na+/H+-dicarboxylate symporter|uniref:Dicarboxylate/amino acid:cation symporter n=1 Tax=Olsenella porci TaxID=2652279 RepID=A0A6N7XMD9_9ACTN|nr:dicarboxylate/amino acid:cation symporter [Olsenella porci]MST72398.1 dicarboxylate/amino acid:cation symporter [Olsenella porci]
MAETKKKVSSTTWIVLSMVLGVIAGFVIGEPMTQVKFIGDIFFHLVQMGIIPFVMCTIIEAVGALDAKALSGYGLKGIAWFAGSSLLAAGIGLVLAVIIQPGAGIAAASAAVDYEASNVTFQDTISGFFGSNIVSSMSEGSMVQCIVFAIALGLACSAWRRAHDNECLVYDVCSQLSKLILNIIRGVMKIAPIGIFCYVGAMIGSLGLAVLIPVAMYLLVMLIAVVIMFAIWIALVSVRCHYNPVKLIQKMWPMSALALGTISSAVTLPTALEDTKSKLGADPEIADLLMALGMPLNSNGAAIHLAVTALTIAQIYGVAFGPGELVYVWVISFLLSLANAVSPGASLVSMTMIVPQLGLPMESIAIFAGLEYPTGALRTILNVDGDVYTCLMVSASEGKLHPEVFNGEEKAA